MEVSIGSEDDIDLIRAKMLSKLDSRVNIMNFKVKFGEILPANVPRRLLFSGFIKMVRASS